MAIGRVLAYLAYTKPGVAVQHGAGAYLMGYEEQRKDKQMDSDKRLGSGGLCCT